MNRKGEKVVVRVNPSTLGIMLETGSCTRAPGECHYDIKIEVKVSSVDLFGPRALQHTKGMGSGTWNGNMATIHDSAFVNVLEVERVIAQAYDQVE